MCRNNSSLQHCFRPLDDYMRAASTPPVVFCSQNRYARLQYLARVRPRHASRLSDAALAADLAYTRLLAHPDVNLLGHDATPQAAAVYGGTLIPAFRRALRRDLEQLIAGGAVVVVGVGGSSNDGQIDDHPTRLAGGGDLNRDDEATTHLEWREDVVGTWSSDPSRIYEWLLVFKESQAQTEAQGRNTQCTDTAAVHRQELAATTPPASAPPASHAPTPIASELMVQLRMRMLGRAPEQDDKTVLERLLSRYEDEAAAAEDGLPGGKMASSTRPGGTGPEKDLQGPKGLGASRWAQEG
ncbi:hypothetical protein GGR56DRAFT_679009 [Xylariaceae sp. FL0804]|nr:hypothetical protein GGR56DRAFT_679009 [Xylariaceae sp. FL0804]